PPWLGTPDPTRGAYGAPCPPNVTHRGWFANGSPRAPGPTARHRTIDSRTGQGPLAAAPRSDLKGTSYELFMLLLSLLALANVFIVLIAGPLSVAGEVAILIEIAITPFFLFDFAYRLLKAP